MPTCIGRTQTRVSIVISASVCGTNAMHHPDLQAVLARAGPYQASSIHSRRRLSFHSRTPGGSRSSRWHADRGTPPATLSSLPALQSQGPSQNIRNPRERRLLSDLWLMSAASFRRMEKLDQARSAIQEAEQLDEENEAVWVQVSSP